MPVEPQGVDLDATDAVPRAAGCRDVDDAGTPDGTRLLHEAAAAPPAHGGGRRPRRVASHELFAGAANELEIVHGEWIYRLRRTTQGKLILTK